MFRDPLKPLSDKPTRKEVLARKRFAQHLREFDHEASAIYDLEEKIPDAWRTLEEDIDVAEAKVKITLLVDASVAKFFRAMGKGYQARVNHILRTYAQFKIGEVDRLWEVIEKGTKGSDR